MESEKNNNTLKQSIIEMLEKLSQRMSNLGNAKDDGQMVFIAEGLQVLLHASRELERANIYHKYINRYVLDFALSTNQISFKDVIIQDEVLKGIIN